MPRKHFVRKTSNAQPFSQSSRQIQTTEPQKLKCSILLVQIKLFNCGSIKGALWCFQVSQRAAVPVSLRCEFGLSQSGA